MTTIIFGHDMKEANHKQRTAFAFLAGANSYEEGKERTFCKDISGLACLTGLKVGEGSTEIMDYWYAGFDSAERSGNICTC